MEKSLNSSILTVHTLYFLSTLCSHAYVILHSFNFAFVHLKYELKQAKDKG